MFKIFSSSGLPAVDEAFAARRPVLDGLKSRLLRITKKHVHELSDNNNRSRGAGGVWEIRELDSSIGYQARIEIIKTNR